MDMGVVKLGSQFQRKMWHNCHQICSGSLMEKRCVHTYNCDWVCGFESHPLLYMHLSLTESVLWIGKVGSTPTGCFHFWHLTLPTKVMDANTRRYIRPVTAIVYKQKLDRKEANLATLGEVNLNSLMIVPREHTADVTMVD